MARLDPRATLHFGYQGILRFHPGIAGLQQKNIQAVLRLSGEALGEQRLNRPMLAGQGEELG